MFFKKNIEEYSINNFFYFKNILVLVNKKCIWEVFNNFRSYMDIKDYKKTLNYFQINIIIRSQLLSQKLYFSS